MRPSAYLCLPLVLALCGAATAAASGERDAAATPPPNLVLVSIDTLRADHVGAYGYPRPTTPHLDALAADGVRFETCIAHAPTTLASHGSILTSRLPHHHGASISRVSKLAPGVVTLAEVLAGEGYRTASVNGGIQLDAAYGLDRGFDLYDSAEARTAGAEVLANPSSRTIGRVERALAWLAEAPGPFFLFLHSYEIHHPYTPDPEHLALFDEGYAGPLGDQIGVGLLKAVKRGKVTLSEADLRHVVATYDAELRSTDAALGVLVAALRERGLYDRSLIVVTSDHGEEFGEHGVVGWHSHTLYDELLRVPLIVKLPESRFAGTVVRGQVRGIDVAPTALAALGVAAPPGFAGRDLGPAIAGAQSATLPAVSLFDSRESEPGWTIRQPRWKLLSEGGARLFDLRADPGESNDVSGEHADRVQSMDALGRRLLGGQETAPVTRLELPEETQELLRALGYVE